MSTLTIEEVSISSQAPGAGGVSRLLDGKLYEGAISILDYRAPEAASDTAAFGLAVATGKPVYLPAGQGTGGDGEYLISTAAVASGNAEKVGFLTAGTTIFGDGMGRTIIRPADPDDVIFRALSVLSELEETTVDNVTLHDMTLYGYVQTAVPALSEHVHLAQLSGVRNLLVARVEFKGFRGDGLYFGIGEISGILRHNYNCTVWKCVFDGINRENRNGITFIDIDGFLIEDCVFRNLTEATMPGAIDLEPDPTNDDYIIRNGTIRDCSFSNVGGNVGVISVYIDDSITEPAREIRIVSNNFRAYQGTGADIAILNNRTVAHTDDDMAILIEGNRGVGGLSPFSLMSLKGVTLRSNTFKSYLRNATIGLTSSTNLIDCRIEDLRMQGCGTEVDGRGLRIGTVDGLDLVDVLLYKCGAASSFGFPIQFAQGQTSDRVAIRGLRIVANTSQTTAIHREGGSHTFGPGNSGSNNRLIDSDLGGLASEFVATGKGQLLTGSATWNPGSLTNGTGETSSAITVTGASFGDNVQVAAPYDLQGIACSGYVSASNAVKIRLQNGTGGTLDLASGTWKVLVTKALA